MLRYLTLAIIALCAAAALRAQDSIAVSVDEVTVTADGGRMRRLGAANTDIISAVELTRAACCNLGESFSTNPSVDVNYSDAATGARQIRLLGLSGRYVQMLTENIPNLRGAAAPFGLGYIPGPWMQSIQVSKGASSVKNGYESITGQINVEMKKPQLDPSLSANVYYDMMNKLEANVDGNLHFGRNWSAGLLTHFENAFSAHDANGDGFADMPRVRQLSAMPRVAYLGRQYVFQLAVKLLDETRRGGQLGHGGHHAPANPYLIDIDTRRVEAFAKNAYVIDRDADNNIALILSGSSHSQHASYGLRIDNANQLEGFASLMWERKWGDLHALSAGAQLKGDRLRFRYRLDAVADGPLGELTETEAVPGIYAQYTLNLADRLVAMGGVRYDRSSVHGSMFTPRMHLRFNPSATVSLHASAGRGFRSPHPLADCAYLLASSRTIHIAPGLGQESAWNLGGGGEWSGSVAGRTVGVSAEYYYTAFSRYLMVNLDRDPHAAWIYSSDGGARSHAVQVELTAEPVADLSVSLAWRLTDVRAPYRADGGMAAQPLVSRHKGLATASWQPCMGLWQFDVTCAVNGSGRMPDGFGPDFRPYVTLNAQATRHFRHFSVYIGGENLTGYRQPDPIVGASNPWAPDFDATMIYGPLQGAMIYAGFRYNITKYI